MLLEGNRRYASGLASHPHQSAGRRAEVLAGQQPFAVVLGCSDSRVPVEELFDQGIGDLFVIRNAGNIVDDVVLGSIEYAAQHLGVPLVLVLGHTSCGAVTAAVQGGECNGHLPSIFGVLRPAVEAGRSQPGDAVRNATLANIWLMVNQIGSSEPLLSGLSCQGRLKITGALYHLDNGQVEIV